VNEPPRASLLLTRALPYLFSVWGLIAAAFLIDPQVQRSGALSEVAYWVSFTGKELLVVVIAAGALLFVTREGTPRPKAEGAGLVFVMALLVGGGALFNEYGLKRVMRVPRPFVQELADEGRLGLTAEAFYDLGGKAERRAHLKTVLTADSDPDLNPRLREHWVVETGFSFPSGHSFASYCCASFLLALGALLPLSTGRRVLLALLPLWAAGVCYSRPLLGVHSTLDITVGAGLGLLFGAGGAVALSRVAYYREDPSPEA
jgi:phosphatidylglycerophosphatase B